jgi:hypothetical protein
MLQSSHTSSQCLPYHLWLPGGGAPYPPLDGTDITIFFVTLTGGPEVAAILDIMAPLRAGAGVAKYSRYCKGAPSIQRRKECFAHPLGGHGDRQFPPVIMRDILALLLGRGWLRPYELAVLPLPLQVPDTHVAIRQLPMEVRLGLHCPKSSLGNILAQKFSQPAWGQYRFSLRKFLFSNNQGRNTSNL